MNSGKWSPIIWNVILLHVPYREGTDCGGEALAFDARVTRTATNREITV